MTDKQTQERVVPFYACEHGIPGGCAKDAQKTVVPTPPPLPLVLDTDAVLDAYGLVIADCSDGENRQANLLNAAYLTHAGNAYPKLVERTERAAMTVFDPAQFPDASAETLAAIKRGWGAAMNTVWERNSALLRELGEEAMKHIQAIPRLPVRITKCEGGKRLALVNQDGGLISYIDVAATSYAPYIVQAANEHPALLKALGNCYTMARRELHRLRGESPPSMQRERWEHIKRFCEETGLREQILRASLPTELTDGG